MLLAERLAAQLRSRAMPGLQGRWRASSYQGSSSQPHLTHAALVRIDRGPGAGLPAEGLRHDSNSTL